MDRRLVFVKTPKGNDEITSRAYRLNHGLRYVLILVNGKSTVAEILAKGVGLPNMEQSLDELAVAGFIHTLTETTQSQVQKYSPKDEIIALSKTMLGAQATPIIKKLRESADTPEALAQTADTCKRLIKLAINDTLADEFVRRSQEIIFSSTLQIPLNK